MGSCDASPAIAGCSVFSISGVRNCCVRALLAQLDSAVFFDDARYEFRKGALAEWFERGRFDETASVKFEGADVPIAEGLQVFLQIGIILKIPFVDKAFFRYVVPDVGRAPIDRHR